MVVKAKNIRQAIRMNSDTLPGIGSPYLNAAEVISTPSSASFFHSPEITIESPVIVQMHIVSINVPVIVTSP